MFAFAAHGVHISVPTGVVGAVPAPTYMYIYETLRDVLALYLELLKAVFQGLDF